ncbi:MAG: phosphopantetheine-binding protein [Planctomycetota bacterium]
MHQRPALATAFVAPTTDLQSDLAAMVREIVGIGEVGVDDNLFELGFDSLLAHRLIGLMQERLTISVPLRRVLEAPTVGELAKFVEATRFAKSLRKKSRR